MCPPPYGIRLFVCTPAYVHCMHTEACDILCVCIYLSTCSFFLETSQQGRKRVSDFFRLLNGNGKPKTQGAYVQYSIHPHGVGDWWVVLTD